MACLGHFGPSGSLWYVWGTFVRLGHFGPFGALWSVWVTLVRLGNFGPFGVDGVTGSRVYGFTGLWIHGSRVYWFMGLRGDGTIRGHGSIGQSVHGLTGVPADGFTGLRIHSAASVHAVVVSHHVAADGGGTSSGLCEILDQDFCRSAPRC